ncbi:MAG: glycosyltransferase family 1 protein, partial [Planctomycetota bacterium]
MAARRVLLLSRYGALGASTRVRSLQFLPRLRAEGIDVTVAPLFDDDYVRRMYAGEGRRWGALLGSYTARVLRLARGRR